MKNLKETMMEKVGNSAEFLAQASANVNEGFPCLFIVGEEPMPESLRRLKEEE